MLYLTRSTLILHPPSILLIQFLYIKENLQGSQISLSSSENSIIYYQSSFENGLMCSIYVGESKLGFSGLRGQMLQLE